MYIIGVDPHPGYHTAAVLDHNGAVLETRTFPNTHKGLLGFLSLICEFKDPTLAVEGPTQHFFIDWTTRLLAEGFTIIPIAPQMTSTARRRRGKGKSDPMDAQHIGRALLAHPDLPPFSLPSWLLPLKEIVRTRQSVSKDLKAYSMRLKTVQGETVIDTIQTLIEFLKQQLSHLDKQIAQKVKELAPQLLGILGVGPVVAAVMLTEVRDITRFKSADAFANYCGASPIQWQSGASSVVRVNPGGNRTLNWALHIIAMTRLRREPRTRAYFDRKVDEGKRKRAIFRILKTYIAREIYSDLNHLWEDNNSYYSAAA